MLVAPRWVGPRRRGLRLVGTRRRRRCFFCWRRINGKFKVGWNWHHKTPERCFAEGEDHETGNLYPSHIFCHVTWNRVFDRHRLIQDPPAYLEEYADIDLGSGIFATVVGRQLLKEAGMRVSVRMLRSLAPQVLQARRVLIEEAA